MRGGRARSFEDGPLVYAGRNFENGDEHNAELLGISGPRNPYPGKLGVVEEGAFADLLLVDGDPISNIKLIEEPGRNLLIIMRDRKNIQEYFTRITMARIRS